MSDAFPKLRMRYIEALFIIAAIMPVFASYVDLKSPYLLVGVLIFRETIDMVRWLYTDFRREQKERAPQKDKPHFVFIPVTRNVRRSKSGYVYLLQSAAGHYKIGRTVDPDNRMRTFNVKLPFEVDYICTIPTPDMYALEFELHARFAAKRVNGEWFDLDAEDVAYIKEIGE